MHKMSNIVESQSASRANTNCSPGEEFTSANCADFIRYIDDELHSQTASTMQMVGAMIASQPQFGKNFISWLLAKVEQVAPINEISPIVLAAIKIYVFAEALEHNMAIQACMPEYTLIRATGKEQEFRKAIVVVTNISYKYIEFEALIKNQKYVGI